MSQLMFEEVLEQDTRSHLAQTARFLGIKIKSSQRKAGVVATIAGAIKASPEEFLRQLPLQELLRLRDLVFDDYLVMPHNHFIVPDCLEHIGMVQVIEVEELTLDVIPADLAGALRPVINQVAQQAAADHERNQRQQLLHGLINLHGILSQEELADQAASIDGEFASQQVHDLIRESFLMKSMEMQLFGERHFCSPYVEDIDRTLGDILTRWEVERARFSFKQAMDAGIWAQPLPPGNPATKKLLLRLAASTQSEEIAGRLLSHFWINLNNGGDAIGPFTKVMGGESPSLKELQAAISLFMDWTNHTPRWILKGNTPNHTVANYKPAALNQPPRLVLGPNATAAGLDIPQEAFNQMWEQNKPAPKVGRNQPCPCGSGRKYKNCCMRK